MCELGGGPAGYSTNEFWRQGYRVISEVARVKNWLPVPKGELNLKIGRLTGTVLAEAVVGTAGFTERRPVAEVPLSFQWHRSVISPAVLHALHPLEWLPCLAW